MQPARIYVATEVTGKVVVGAFQPRRGGGLQWLGPVATRATAGRVAAEACRFALPADAGWYRTLRLPGSPGRARARLIAFEASRVFPISGLDLVWDHGPTLALGGTPAELLVGLARGEVASRQARLREQGYRLSHLEPAGAALYRSFRYLHPTEARPGLIIDLGGSTNQVLAVEGPRWMLRPVAEAPVQGGPSRLERLHLEIARLVATMPPERPPVWGVVVGEAEAAAAITRELAERLSLPLVPFDVWPEVGGPEGDVFPSSDIPRSLLPVLLGLALRPSAGEKGLNLLPPALQREETRRRRRPALIAASTVVALSLGGLAWRDGARAAEVTERADRLRRELPELRESARRQEVAAAQTHAQEERLRRAQWLGDEQARWPRFLADLQRAVDAAGDAWIDRLEPESEPKATEVAWIIVHGRVLDPTARAGGVSDEARRGIKAMLVALRSSQSVAGVAGERFSPDEPGILRFELRAQLASATVNNQEL